MSQCGTRNACYRHGGRVGGRPSRTYGIYRAMRNRCLNPNDRFWSSYGGRGVAVCARWLGRYGFPNFLADMGEAPPGLSLDRWPNKDGNYEPGNCRWATMKEQQRNRTNNRLITFNGATKPLCQWQEETGVPVGKRLRDGWTLENAITLPKGARGLRHAKESQQ